MSFAAENVRPGPCEVPWDLGCRDMSVGSGWLGFLFIYCMPGPYEDLTNMLHS